MEIQVIILAVVQLCMTLVLEMEVTLSTNGTRVRLSAVETEQQLIQRAMESSSKLSWGLTTGAITQTWFRVFLMAQVLVSSNNGIQLILITEIPYIMEFTWGLGLQPGVYFLEQYGKAHTHNPTGVVWLDKLRKYGRTLRQMSVMIMQTGTEFATTILK